MIQEIKIILYFQKKPYEEKIKILIEENKYNEALQKLIDSLPEEVDDKYQKMEQLYLDFTRV